MEITFWQIIIFSYVTLIWGIFPLFTNKETTYLESVKACHFVILPIFVLAGMLGFIVGSHN